MSNVPNKIDSNLSKFGHYCSTHFVFKLPCFKSPIACNVNYTENYLARGKSAKNLTGVFGLFYVAAYLLVLYSKYQQCLSKTGLKRGTGLFSSTQEFLKLDDT